MLYFQVNSEGIGCSIALLFGMLIAVVLCIVAFRSVRTW